MNIKQIDEAKNEILAKKNLTVADALRLRRLDTARAQLERENEAIRRKEWADEVETEEERRAA